MKVCLAAMCRHENKYLKEWITYHHDVCGVDHFFLGDNNDIVNDEDIQEFVNSNGFGDIVTVIDRKKKPETMMTVQSQIEFYQYVYDNMVGEYDWLMCFDVDEFFEVNNCFMNGDKNVGRYIETCCNKCQNSYGVMPEQIMVSWMFMTDGGKLFYEDTPVRERFKDQSNRILNSGMNTNNHCGKCFVRCGNPNLVFRDMHCAMGKNPEIPFRSTYNGGGVMVDDMCMNGFFIRNDAVIRHYFTKSLEEFVQRKLFDTTNYTSIDIADTVRKYFDVNEPTPEKFRLFELYMKLWNLQKTIVELTSEKNDEKS